MTRGNIVSAPLLCDIRFALRYVRALADSSKCGMQHMDSDANELVAALDLTGVEQPFTSFIDEFGRYKYCFCFSLLETPSKRPSTEDIISIIERFPVSHHLPQWFDYLVSPLQIRHIYLGQPIRIDKLFLVCQALKHLRHMKTTDTGYIQPAVFSTRLLDVPRTKLSEHLRETRFDHVPTRLKAAIGRGELFTHANTKVVMRLLTHDGDDLGFYFEPISYRTEFRINGRRPKPSTYNRVLSRL